MTDNPHSRKKRSLKTLKVVVKTSPMDIRRFSGGRYGP
jgi:hypothetical protein